MEVSKEAVINLGKCNRRYYVSEQNATKPIHSLLADFCLKVQNHNLVLLNLAAQHFTEVCPGSLHVSFHKEGTNTSQQSQRAVLTISALRNKFKEPLLSSCREKKQKSSASTYETAVPAVPESNLWKAS